VVFVEEVDEVPRGAIDIFSAHGVVRHVSEEAKKRGLFALNGIAHSLRKFTVKSNIMWRTVVRCC
jgi:4-hydroxy-3-methylbut-2-enyl diphosphate reductase